MRNNNIFQTGFVRLPGIVLFFRMQKNAAYSGFARSHLRFVVKRCLFLRAGPSTALRVRFRIRKDAPYAFPDIVLESYPRFF